MGILRHSICMQMSKYWRDHLTHKQEDDDAFKINICIFSEHIHLITLRGEWVLHFDVHENLLGYGYKNKAENEFDHLRFGSNFA